MAPSTESMTPEDSDLHEIHKALLSIKVLLPKFKQINVDLWDVPATPTSTPEHLLTYLVSRYAMYTYAEFIDGQLLSAFYEDFEGWNEEIFTNIHLDFKRILKTTLQHGGVYTGRGKGGIGKQMVELI
jgi:hypothetical protein